MSGQYPPQQPYNNDNPQQPYYQPPLYGQPQSQYNPQQIPAIPPQQYPQPGQQFAPPQKKKRKSIRETWNSGTGGKCGILFACGVLFIGFVVCVGAINAANSGSQAIAQPTQAPHNAPVIATTKPVATVKPKPTAKPRPTATPTPRPSPAQIEATYKASTTDSTVASLDKDGNADSGNDEHFTATLVAFVKDSSGNTAGANVTDGSGSFVQVIFTPGTDITQLNANDTIEVWGTNQGVSSGTNAFGGTVQEVVIQANYLSDQTTGYKADS